MGRKGKKLVEANWEKMGTKQKRDYSEELEINKQFGMVSVEDRHQWMDSMILVSLFEVNIFCDSVILWYGLNLEETGRRMLPYKHMISKLYFLSLLVNISETLWTISCLHPTPLSISHLCVLLAL